MKLKVCGMRERENSRELVETIKPDWMGLIFYPKSPRFVGNEAAAYLKDLPIAKVGVFVNAGKAEILDKINLFGLKVVQLHGDESVEFVRDLKQSVPVTVFKVWSVGDKVNWSELIPYLPYVDYFLFDTFTKSYGGSGKSFNWEILLDYPFDKPFLLSGGLGLDQIPSIIKLKSKMPYLAGLDINSRFETEPALKDLDLIKKFNNNLKEI